MFAFHLTCRKRVLIAGKSSALEKQHMKHENECLFYIMLVGPATLLDHYDIINNENAFHNCGEINRATVHCMSVLTPRRVTT